MRRVVVTGIGVVAPNGTSASEFWRSCCEGISGISRLTRVSPDGLPTQVAGRGSQLQFTQVSQRSKSLKVMGRHVQLAVERVQKQSPMPAWANRLIRADLVW